VNEARDLFSRIWYVWLVLALAILVGVTWGNYVYAVQNPGGNDFLVHWVGTRSLLVDGVSPYSDEVATRIQTLAYGRPARPGEHELRVAYPLYSAIIFLPYALIGDYTLARALWMTTLEFFLVLMAFLNLRLASWKLSAWMMPIYLFYSIFWYFSLRALINGNVVILVTLLISGAFAALRSGRDELAGILLAFATIKPHVVVVILLYILVWTLSQRRWRTMLWLLITVGLLSASAALFLPDWPLQNLREVLRYSSYNPPGTPGAVFATWLPATGRTLGWVLSGLLILLLLVEWSFARNKEFRWFLWTGSLTLVASQWIGIQTDPGNFVLLFIPLVLTWAILEEHWGRRGRPVIWLLMVITFAGLWALFLQTVNYVDQPLQSPIMFFPLPLFLFVALYWVRWWAIRPVRLLIEYLRDFEE
jgi:hypothetical protein